MRIALFIAALLFSAPAFAQNTTCFTAPNGDKTNKCASTAFVNNSLSNYYVLIDNYGAPGDGINDDRPAASAAAAALGGRGGTIQFSCNKNYRFNTSFVIPNNIILRICADPPVNAYAWTTGVSVPGHLLLSSAATITPSDRSGIVGIITQAGIDAGLPTLDATGFAGTAIRIPSGGQANDTYLNVLLVGFAKCLDGTGAIQAGRPDWHIECDGQAGAAGSTEATIVIPNSFDRGFVYAHTWPYATAAHVGGTNRRTGYATKILAGNCDDETFDIFDSFHEVGLYAACNGAANWKNIWLENNAVRNAIFAGGGFMNVESLWLWKDTTASPALFNPGWWDIKYLFCGIGGTGPCVEADGATESNIHIGHLDVNGGAGATSVINAATITPKFKIDGCFITNMAGGSPAPFTGVAGTQVDQFTLAGGCNYTSTGSYFSGPDFTYVPSATTLLLYPNIDSYAVTGTTNISTITTGWAGRKITLYFTGALTIVNGAGLSLQNGANFITAAGSVLKLESDIAGGWHEISRSPMGTAALAATGTSGHTIPFLDGNNAFSGTNTATTQVANDNSTKLATTAYIDRAWTTYTPTLSCVTGTLTSASATGRYKSFGKTYFVEINASITTNGTCATALNATLPNSILASALFSFAGREMAITGKMIGGVIVTGSNVLSFVNYDNTYPGVNGSNLAISGVVEAQ